jgi:hypothetical protein
MRKAAQIVRGLVGEDHCVQRMLGEASVHRPARGGIYVAAYTGPAGAQCWKSTGTDDPAAAMVIARELEAAARAERAQAGRVAQPQRIRNRQSPGNPGAGLTQREVAQLLGMTERGVRAVEKRALRKLWQHPLLRKLWDEYLRGELIEHAARLSTAELQVLVGMARSRAERETLRKVFAIIQN